MLRNYKGKIDEQNRVVIPPLLLDYIEVEPGGFVNITGEYGSIVIDRDSPECWLCKKTEDLAEVEIRQQTFLICGTCATRILLSFTYQQKPGGHPALEALENALKKMAQEKTEE